MAWQLRRLGSPHSASNLTFDQVVDGLRSGTWDPTDEVRGPDDAGWRPIEEHPNLAELAVELEPAAPAHPQEATSLDMNALIDVCLVLLIFFILTTSYVNMTQKVVPAPMTVREGKSAVKVVRPDEVKARMIRVEARLDGEGKTLLNVDGKRIDVAPGENTAIDIDSLADVLRPLTRGADRRTEMLLDARGIRWEALIQIQDAAKSAGVKTIHLLQRTAPKTDNKAQ